MQEIQKSYVLKAPLRMVWDALVNSDEINSWGAGPAQMSDKKGFEFKLWGEEIHGTNTEVIYFKRLEQNWYSGGAWTQPSKVIISLSEDGEKITQIILSHTNIPENAHKEINEGWDKFYFGPLKKYVEQKYRRSL